ncbi:MAG: 1-phosphofructokinase family hexose kinase [Omnitrophica bacterium]|nr:1-phosphofructokinase family hexose kinase [Candidatus Omnitrophota bacterium]
MRKYILTVTLNPAIDKTVKVPNFKTGKDFREQNLSLSAGGKGINTSQVLKHLGVPTLATGFLGGGGGEYIKNQLNKEKIKYDFCAIGNNTRTSLTILDPRLNTITRLLERGPKITKKELNAFRRKFSSLLNNCRYVIISGRNAVGVTDSFYGELIAEAKKKNILTVFDTSGKPYELGLIQRPFMVKPNLKEAEQITGLKILTISEVKQAAFYFYKRGIQISAITLGSLGAIVFNGQEMLLAIPPKLKRKNPVGCGDSFIAGFIAWHWRKRSFRECVKMATICGAANALSLNPGFIKPGTIQKVSRQVKIKTLKYNSY